MNRSEWSANVALRDTDASPAEIELRDAIARESLRRFHRRQAENLAARSAFLRLIAFAVSIAAATLAACNL